MVYSVHIKYIICENVWQLFHCTNKLINFGSKNCMSIQFPRLQDCMFPVIGNRKGDGVLQDIYISYLGLHQHLMFLSCTFSQLINSFCAHGHVTALASRAGAQCIYVNYSVHLIHCHCHQDPWPQFGHVYWPCNLQLLLHMKLWPTWIISPD